MTEETRKKLLDAYEDACFSFFIIEGTGRELSSKNYDFLRQYIGEMRDWLKDIVEEEMTTSTSISYTYPYITATRNSDGTVNPILTPDKSKVTCVGTDLIDEVVTL